MRRSTALISCAVAIAGFLAVAAAPAVAQDTYARDYESQITGFGNAAGISIDPAGHPWIVDSAERLSTLVTEYAPYPSLTRIFEQAGQGQFRPSGSGYTNAAIDGANGDLYVADTGAGANLQVFDPNNFVEEWTLSGGTSWVGIDNSGGSSNGRLYVATFNPGQIKAFEPGQVPAPFSCGAPCSGYIEGNVITGTPSGPFPNIENVKVDEHGNIFASAYNNGGHVFEFKPSGEFLRDFETPGVLGTALDPTNDHLVVFGNGGTITEYSATGEVLGHLFEGAPGEKILGSGAAAGMAVNSAGDLYVSSGERVDIFSPAFLLPKITYEPVSPLERNSATLHATVSPAGGEPVTSCHVEYGKAAGEYNLGSKPCEPNPASSNFTTATPVKAELTELTTDTTYHYRIVAGNAKVTQVGEDQTFTTPTAVNGVTTEAATGVTNHAATLHGSFTGEAGLSNEYFFEYGTSAPGYGHKVSGVVPAPPSGSEPEHVENPIENLLPGTTYHFRLVVKNSTGISFGSDQTFATYQPPAIEGLSSSELSASSAVLRARVNPDGLPAGTEAQCHFEYGPTTEYGTTAPCPESLSGTTGEPIEVKLTGLQQGSTYHFRLIATNRWGTVTSPDQSFEFFPSNCPNSAVRQQTGAGYLPDCRAYELVSPPNANGSLLFSGGPNTGQATNPSRFSFVGAFSSLPGAEPIDTAGDLYVSTRTPNGWETKYIGPSGSEAGCVGNPPNDPWSRDETKWPKFQSHVITDPSMSSFIDFADGSPLSCVSNQNGIGDATGPIDLPSDLGHVWAADGSSLGTLPAGLTPTELASLRCPNFPGRGAYQNWGVCHGDVASSSDLRHFFFSSNLLNYTSGGSTEEPGGAYDYDRATGTLTRISGLAAGGQIAPGNATDFPSGGAVTTSPFIHFAAVSSDGSHVLMTDATRSEVCTSTENEMCRRYTDEPLHLYMSVEDEPALDVSENQHTHANVAVHYVGMTPDGSRVYFTSEEHLTEGVPGEENPGHVGASLYLWEAAKALRHEDPLTLVSKANPGSPGEAGDTGNCHPVESWTAGCGVTVYSPAPYSEAAAARGGNDISDGPIAANGDIYFSSPEQLAGDRGVPDQQNLYDYRQGRLQFVTTFPVENMCPTKGTIEQNGYHYIEYNGALTKVTAHKCAPSSTCLTNYTTVGESVFEGVHYRGNENERCSEGPIARLEINSTDTHMAFVTPSRVTAYDNFDQQGTCRHGTFGEPMGEKNCTEMYSFDPASETLTCDSCNPDGRPPTSDVYASQDGLFLTNDGRTFFSTEEALVPADTNQGTDVYEFADGRPRLITPGTGTAAPTQAESEIAEQVAAGLIGVSANGTDVYFSTFDVLTSEDHNGNFLKFYDARTDGGFPHPTAVQPCAAAEECHGPGTEAPVLPAQGTSANLTGGNAAPGSHSKHHKKHRRKGKRHNHRAAHHSRGAVR